MEYPPTIFIFEESKNKNKRKNKKRNNLPKVKTTAPKREIREI